MFNVLQITLMLMPLIQEAEWAFGAGTGANKKQFILDAISALGDGVLTRFGLSAEQIRQFQAIAPEAIDLGVSLMHFIGGFRATDKQKAAAHAALSQPAPVAPIMRAAEQSQ